MREKLEVYSHFPGPDMAGAPQEVVKSAMGLINLLEARGLRPDGIAEVSRAVAASYNYHNNPRDRSRILRKSGEHFSVHAIEVAKILAEAGVNDVKVIDAALLHDVPEDVPLMPTPHWATKAIDHEYLKKIKQEIRDGFSPKVLKRIERVTKVSDHSGGGGYKSRRIDTLNMRLTYEKVFASLRQDPGAVLIKLADRLHNMRTIKALPDYKQRDIARETVSVYAPLARLCSMRAWSDELYTLGMSVLHPRETDEARSVRDAALSDEYCSIEMASLRNYFPDVQIDLEELPLADILLETAGNGHGSGEKGFNMVVRNREEVAIPVAIKVESISDFLNRYQIGISDYTGTSVRQIRNVAEGRTEEFVMDFRSSGGCMYKVVLYTQKGMEHRAASVVDLYNGSAKDIKDIARAKLKRPWLYFYQIKGPYAAQSFVEDAMRGPLMEVVGAVDRKSVQLPRQSNALDYCFIANRGVLGMVALGVRINGHDFGLGEILKEDDVIDIVSSKRWVRRVADLDRLNTVLARRQLSARLAEVRRQQNRMEEGAGLVPMYYSETKSLPTGLSEEDFYEYAEKIYAEGLARGRLIMTKLMGVDKFGDIKGLEEAWQKYNGKPGSLDDFVFELGIEDVGWEVLENFLTVLKKERLLTE